MSAPSVSDRQAIESARDAVARWLLNGEAQIRDGTHAGGVAGLVSSDGCAAYVYPEITGYYLQCLAWYASRWGNTAELMGRAKAAQDWLRTWLHRDELPATRVHLSVAAADWRNTAIFFFDVAMVARGLASAVRAQLLEPDPMVTRRLSELLSQLVAEDGMFVACLKRDANATLPDRWSTRRGGFLAKAAAGLLIAARDLPFDARVLGAAEITYATSVQWALDQPHDHSHARLYAIEGYVGLADHYPVEGALPSLRRQLTELFQIVRRSGHVPESRATAGTARLDVAAQAVRAARLLWPRGAPHGPDQRALSATVRLLVRSVGPDGTVPFNLGGSPRFACVWAAMFAEQALTLAQCDDGDPLLSRCSAWLV